jgi:hypothetical protein
MMRTAIFFTTLFGLLLCATLSGAADEEADFLTEIRAIKERLEVLEGRLSGAALREKPLQPQFGTPEQTFATYQHAEALRNWKVYVQCTSAKKQRAEVGGMIARLSFLPLFMEDNKRPRATLAIEAFFKKHLPQMLEPTPKREPTGTPETRAEFIVEIREAQARFKAEMEKKADQVNDHPAFLIDAYDLMYSLDPEKAKANFRIKQLTDVKVTGDTALGIVRAPGGAGKAMRFARSNGVWLIEEPDVEPAEQK